MSFWDPLLVNTLAEARPVILFDNAGIGESTGPVATTFKGWAQNLIDLLSMLNIPQIDLLGFSMGGAAVQMVALEAPSLVRRLILAGTTASMNPAFESGPVDIFKQLARADHMEDTEVKSAFTVSFFPHTPAGRAAANESWTRIQERVSQDNAKYLSASDARSQGMSFGHWMSGAGENSSGRLAELKIPVLVANGDDDLLIPTSNSWFLHRNIRGSELIIYPDAGHGFLFQYAERFGQHVNEFLDREDLGEKSRL
jgi:pimeloyl-ACP methyl ester carboxylesterase